MRLTARVSGRIQMAGYRARVVALARGFGLSGFVQNLPDGRVEVVAEGEKTDLERFASALKMENSLIQAEDVEATYSDSSGTYSGFRKIVGSDETGDRLDEGVEILKDILIAIREGFVDLGGKMDSMLQKQDSMLEKQDSMLEKQDSMLEKQDSMLERQDSMLEKQDSTIGEIHGLRLDMKGYMNQRFERIEADLAELKAAMMERGLI